MLSAETAPAVNKHGQNMAIELRTQLKSAPIRIDESYDKMVLKCEQ